MPEFLQPILSAAIPWLNLFILSYYVLVNGVYLSLLLISGFAVERHRRRLSYGAFDFYQESPTTPPVSVLVPAYNESQNIVESISALLALNYPTFEVIVIDDGSTDDTLQRLIRAFHLRAADLIYRPHLPTAPVERFFVNPQIPALTVVSKRNSGKADSLNVGINLARSPYFCSVDADSLLEQDALLRLMAPILEDPEQVLATGGIVRIANGCTVKNGRVEQVKLPADLLSRLQVVEYLRCFLFGRTGWSSLGALLILSGTFSLFHKKTVFDLGGYSTRTVSEDMELVVRLHRWAREQKRRYRVTFIADPICWTEAPIHLNQLARQRRRWHRGLGEALIMHAGMIGNPAYGVVGMVGMPFQLVELLGPLVEFLGYLVVIGAALSGILSTDFLVLYFVLAVLMGVVLSIGAVLLEQLTDRRYPGTTDLVLLVAYAILENFGYRQATVIWRVWGLLQLVTFRRKWEVVKKHGLAQAGVPETAGERQG